MAIKTKHGYFKSKESYDSFQKNILPKLQGKNSQKARTINATGGKKVLSKGQKKITSSKKQMTGANMNSWIPVDSKIGAYKFHTIKGTKEQAEDNARAVKKNSGKDTEVIPHSVYAVYTR